jgi:hypothetical protein
MSLHLVRCNEPIGETGQNFTPENFPQAHDYNCTLIEAAVGSGTSGSSFGFLGNGRLVQNDFAAGAPELTPSPSLAILLPAGSKLRIAGQEYTLEEDVLLDGAPQNFTGYCVPSVVWDEDSQSYLWSAGWVGERPALGSGVLCQVTTDADQVLTIDSSEEESDVIPWLPVLLARLRTLNAGGSGGEGGGFAYSGAAPWLPAPDDSRQTSVVIAALIDAVRADLTAMIQSGGIRPQQTDLSKLISENAILRQEVGKCQLFLRAISALLDLDLQVELGLERSQSANIVGIPQSGVPAAEVYGAGDALGASFPDHLGATTLTMNDDGTVEP